MGKDFVCPFCGFGLFKLYGGLVLRCLHCDQVIGEFKSIEKVREEVIEEMNLWKKKKMRKQKKKLQKK